MNLAVIALPLAFGLSGESPPQRMTLDEFSALTKQLAQCWSLPVPSKNTPDVAVDIDVTVNPDGTIVKAEVADQVRLANDPDFRASVESGLKALHDPKCSPLALPPDKYDEWKSMTIRFDPKEMLGQ